MCRYRREMRVAGAEGPADGETVRLGDRPYHRARSCGGFPWWTLWMIWPLFWLAKGIAQLAAPVAVWLAQPLTLTIPPLPLLLIGAGTVILLVGAIRRMRDE